nr:unnamed protein product [Callosobruchus analis]
MLSHYLEVPEPPMWVGFNSLIYKDTASTRKLCYLTTINASPTNKSVVVETMKQSQQVAKECGEKYMQVTYDLAIAQIALQIQSTEKPRYNDLFIHVRSFHIMMSYFKAIEERSDQPRLLPQNLQNLLDRYQEYKQKTLQGDHGKTVQFYIRTGNFQLFTSVLPKIENLFFAFNQQNYTRYLVKYHNLFKVDQSHPGLKVQLQMRIFGVKRTDKPYSRQPIDLTLEQTINADAANKLAGVSHTTNSISARQRWCKSHTLRSTIISHTMEQAGLRKGQDITADPQKSRINKNSQQLLNFTANIKQNINPFAAENIKIIY